MVSAIHNSKNVKTLARYGDSFGLLVLVTCNQPNTNRIYITFSASFWVRTVRNCNKALFILPDFIDSTQYNLFLARLLLKGFPITLSCKIYRNPCHECSNLDKALINKQFNYLLSPILWPWQFNLVVAKYFIILSLLVQMITVNKWYIWAMNWWLFLATAVFWFRGNSSFIRSN